MVFSKLPWDSFRLSSRRPTCIISVETKNRFSNAPEIHESDSTIDYESILMDSHRIKIDSHWWDYRWKIDEDPWNLNPGHIAFFQGYTENSFQYSHLSNFKKSMPVLFNFFGIAQSLGLQPHLSYWFVQSITAWGSSSTPLISLHQDVESSTTKNISRSKQEL